VTFFGVSMFVSRASHALCQRQQTESEASLPAVGIACCAGRRQFPAQSLSLPSVAFVVRSSRKAAPNVPSWAASPEEPILARLSRRLALELRLRSEVSVGVRALTGRSSGTRRYRALNRRASSGIIFLLRVVLGAPLSLLR
jgi:hypothetical protein